MSYCRFSSDNFQCDVYVYEAIDAGWMTHIAANRIANATAIPTVDFRSADFAEQFAAQLAYVRTANREPIGLPLDGTSHRDNTPGECADRLVALRAMGYIVPQHAIDELRLEAGLDG